MQPPNPFDPRQNENYGPQPSFEPRHPTTIGAVLRRVSEIQAQKLCWLWPGRIPLGKLSLFAGDPGLGKSLVTLDIVARVTRGREWPDGAPNNQPGSVIILSAEDDPGDTIRPRLEAAGADLGKVHILEAVRHAKLGGDITLDHFSLESDLVELQDAIVSLEDVRLVVIDPISAYLGDADSHVNAKIRGLLAPLSRIAQILRFSVVGVDHLGKSNRPALYRPNGSIAFTAAPRAVWFFAKNPDDPAGRLMLPGKMNLSREQTGLAFSLQEKESGVVVVAWGDAVNIPADLVLQPEDPEDRSERLEVMDWLQEELSGGPVLAKQIQKRAIEAGFKPHTLRRAREALGVKPRKDGFGQGWSWVLAPEDVHQPPKMSTLQMWTSSTQVDIFTHQYTRDPDGPGCTCQRCGVHYGTVAGWRAHVGSRCVETETN